MNIDNTEKIPQTGRMKNSFIIWVVLISTILAFSGGSFLGYNLSGWAWFVPLVFSALIITINPTAVSFPFLLWLPWILYVLIWLLFTDYSGLQRSSQLLCPIVIGMATSTCSLKETQFNKLLDMFKYLAGAIVFFAAFRAVTNIVTLAGWAAHSMTVILLCSLFATTYILGRKRDFLWWWLLAVIPFLALTRTAIVVAGLTLPLNFAPMKIKKRIVLLILISLLGIVLFYTSRFQQKMFHQQEGEGEMSDILDNKFSDSGRFAMWEQMDERIKDNLWFGHGTGAGEEFIRRITQGMSGYPHNDWRLSLYDFGIFGTTLFALTLFIASLHAYRRSQIISGEQRLFFLAGSFLFIPFALLMYTDNIMVYVSFFGNLQFTILGLAYAAKHQGQPQKQRKLRIRW